MPGMRGAPWSSGVALQTREIEGVTYTEDYFVYTASVADLTAAGTGGASAVANVNIQANSHFEWLMSTVYAYKDGSSTPVAENQLIPITLQIQDGGSSLQLFSQPLPISSIAGVGKLPYYLPMGRIFMEKATVQFFFTNQDSAQWDNIYFNMHGKKLWPLDNVR